MHHKACNPGPVCSSMHESHIKLVNVALGQLLFKCIIYRASQCFRCWTVWLWLLYLKLFPDRKLNLRFYFFTDIKAVSVNQWHVIEGYLSVESELVGPSQRAVGDSCKLQKTFSAVQCVTGDAHSCKTVLGWQCRGFQSCFKYMTLIFWHSLLHVHLLVDWLLLINASLWFADRGPCYGASLHV